MAPRHLDPKIKFVWIAPEAGALLVIWLLASIGYMMLSVDIGMLSGIPRILVPFIFLIVLFLFGGLPAFGWHHLTYVNFTYELTGHEVIIREGVLTRKRTVIPYTRIQNINTERTLLERMLGLATIKIETAGANQNVSEGMIPGIGNRDSLVSELLEEVERVKKDGSGIGGDEAKGAKPIGSGTAPSGARSGGIPPIPAPSQSAAAVTQDAVLKQILDELKSIKIILGEQAQKKVDFSEMRSDEDLSTRAGGDDAQEEEIEKPPLRPAQRRDPFKIGLESVRVKPSASREPELRKQISNILSARKKKRGR